MDTVDTDTNTEIHPYFVAQATYALRLAQADPDASPEPLARWGQECHQAGIRGRAGVVIDRQGRILAETKCLGTDPSAWYTTAAVATDVTVPVGLELGLAMARVTRSKREQNPALDACPEGDDTFAHEVWCGSRGCMLRSTQVVHIPVGSFTGQVHR